MPESVYHIQLRHFPHNMSRFNLAEPELRVTLLEPWTRDRLVELGERKWDPQRASLIVLQGPAMPPGELTMGRGWRAAQRRCRDVTDELLAATREALAGAGGGAGADVGEGSGSPGERDRTGAVGSAPEPAPPATLPSPRAAAGVVGRGPAAGSQQAASQSADSLGLELLARIGSQSLALRVAWELSEEAHPGEPASVSLVRAERAVAALLRTRLIVLLRRDSAGGALCAVSEQEIEGILAASASWIAAEEQTLVWVRRV